MQLKKVQVVTYRICVSNCFPFLFLFNSVNSGEKKDVVKNLKVGEKNCWIKPNQRSYPLQRREKTKELRLADDIVLPLTLYSLTLLWFIKWLQLKSNDSRSCIKFIFLFVCPLNCFVNCNLNQHFSLHFTSLIGFVWC